MHLYLIRHAQSESNARWEANPGESFHIPDPALTSIGRRQAAAAARAIARTGSSKASQHDPWNQGGFGITHLYSSLMLRAVETAHRIADRLDLPIQGRTDLHEWGGIYEWDEKGEERRGLPGKDRTFFEQNFPRLQLPADFNELGWWNRPHEPRQDVPQRARRVYEDLLGRHRNTADRVLVVSHGGFINFLLGTITGLTAEQSQANLDANFWFILNNTGITRIDIGPVFCGVVYHNRIDHLSPRLVT